MALESRFIGCIRIQPALNDAECDFLLDVLDSDGTLRGTPTGRGDRDVPFARLAWEPCREGCCLQWNPYLEDPKWMVESLRFVVDHLLRPGRRGRATRGWPASPSTTGRPVSSWDAGSAIAPRGCSRPRPTRSPARWCRHRARR